MAWLGEYHASKVSLIISGNVITGFSTDSKVTIDPAEDAVFPQIGVDGDAAVAVNANKSATMTITLMQNSPSVPILRKMANARQGVSVTLNDPSNTGGVTSSENCYIQSIPSAGKNKQFSDVTVTIWMPETEIDS